MNAALRSSLLVDLLRYRRSWGLWLLLVIAAAGARFMVARDDGSGLQVAVNGHLPLLDWPALGVSLGVIVATVLLPVAYIYLRANTTRVRPWQVEEVTAASRVAVALGRFAADAAVLAAMLAVLTAAGAFIGFLVIPGPARIGSFVAALWLIAAPALALIAGLRGLLDSFPAGRRAGGDVIFFIVWLASLLAPLAGANQPASFGSALSDPAGFLRPLAGPRPSPDTDIAIGVSDVAKERIPLDVEAGLWSPGYVPARLTWLAIAVGVAGFGGVVYRQHTARRHRRRPAWLSRLTERGPPPAADRDAPPATFARAPALGLVVAEFRLIGAGRVFALLAVFAAIVGVVGDYRHIGSPAALLLLAFALSAHTGRTDARGLLALTGVAVLSTVARRIAFVVAATAWGVLLAVPAAVVRASADPLILAAEVGGAAALVSMALGWATGSGFAARIVLLIAWYGYLSK